MTTENTTEYTLEQFNALLADAEANGLKRGYLNESSKADRALLMVGATETVLLTVKPQEDLAYDSGMRLVHDENLIAFLPDEVKSFRTAVAEGRIEDALVLFNKMNIWQPLSGEKITKDDGTDDVLTVDKTPVQIRTYPADQSAAVYRKFVDASATNPRQVTPDNYSGSITAENTEQFLAQLKNSTPLWVAGDNSTDFAMTIANALLADVNSEKGMTIVPRAPNKVEAYIAPADMIVSGLRINAGEYIKVTRGKEDAVTTVSPLSASLVATDLEGTEGGTKSHYIDGNQPPIQLVFQTRSEPAPAQEPAPAAATPKEKGSVLITSVIVSLVLLAFTASVAALLSRCSPTAPQVDAAPNAAPVGATDDSKLDAVNIVKGDLQFEIVGTIGHGTRQTWVVTLNDRDPLDAGLDGYTVHPAADDCTTKPDGEEICVPIHSDVTDLAGRTYSTIASIYSAPDLSRSEKSRMVEGVFVGTTGRPR